MRNSDIMAAKNAEIMKKDDMKMKNDKIMIIYKYFEIM